MTEILLPLVNANYQLLADELQQFDWSVIAGRVWQPTPGVLRIIVFDDTSERDLDAIRQVVENHDPEKKTPREIAESERDTLSLFQLTRADSDTWADSQSDADFKRRMTRAFVELRMMVTGE